MSEILQTTGAKLWSTDDYDELWLSIFEQLSGTGSSNIRKIDTAIKNLNEKFENKLDGYWFETVDNRICLCKVENDETVKLPLVLGDVNADVDIATLDKAGIVKPDGVSIVIDENGVISVDKIEVDNELSSTSENPVQNKIVTDELLSKVKIVKVATLPSEDIKKYPVVYALKDKDNSYTLNEYTDDGWVLYGGTNSEVVILTQEAYDELSEEEKHDGTIRYVETDDDNSESSKKYIPFNEKGIAGGIATLNEDGKVPLEQLPEIPEITVDSELSETSENPVQNKVVHKKLDEVFQSVSSGKSLVASAITDKGIVTESDATFQTMAMNISNIPDATLIKTSTGIKIGKYSFDEIETETQTETIADLGYNFYCGSAVALNGYIYTLGGSNNNKLFRRWSNNSAESLTALPFVFYNGCSVVLNNEIHILGSGHSEGRTKHYKWDGASWISVSALPYDFDGGCSVVLNNEIHILGSGHSEGRTKHYKWDGASWISVSTLPFDFCRGSAVVLNNEIHILGGDDNKKAHYKWNGASWISVSTLPFDFYIGSAVVLNNEIHILGSASSEGKTKHYKWNDTSWVSVSTLPYEFYNGSAVVFEKKIHLLGCGISGNYQKHSIITPSEKLYKLIS